MKRALLASAALVFATGFAFAQDAPPPPPAPAANQPAPPPPPPPAPAGHGPDQAMDRGMDHGPGPGMDHAMGRDGPRGPHPMMRFRPDRAAHFRYQDHGVVIDIKCADGQPTEECASLFLKALDKVTPAQGGGDDRDRRGDGDRDRHDDDYNN